MKKGILSVALAMCVVMLSGCSDRVGNENVVVPDGGDPIPEYEDNILSSGSGWYGDLPAQEISNTVTKNDFELTLYADKATYTVDEEIQIRATLEYKGDKDTVTIWHGDPYLTFSITDGKDFQTGGLVMTILTSTELEKGTIYEFAYQKSGGFDTLASDAEFWRDFYAEEALKLPVGTYTITANGNFHLSEQQKYEEKGPSCNLQIEVTGAAVALPAPGTSGPSKPIDVETPADACPYSVMYQGVQYITWADEAFRDSFQDLNQAGEVQSLVPGNRMPTEEFQSNAFPVGTKLWIGDGQFLVETNDPDVFWVFRGWVDGEQTLMTDTVAKNCSGDIEAAVNLTLDDAQRLQWILKAGNWNTEGTADCLNDCVLTLDGQELYYHSDCGTFNVPGAENGGSSLSLDEETRQTVNAILEQYITLGWLP